MLARNRYRLIVFNIYLPDDHFCQQQLCELHSSCLLLFNNKLTFGLRLQRYKIEICRALKTCKIFGMSCTFVGYGNPESIRTFRDRIPGNEGMPYSRAQA